MPEFDAVLAWATVVLAIATVVLVIATIAYARAAQATVSEMKLTRAESIRPVLALTPEVLGANFPIARLSNVGVGAAHNIHGTVRRLEHGVAPRQHEMSIAMMLPKAQHEIFVDINEDEQHVTQSAQEMATKGRAVSVDLTYEDPVGRSYRLIADVGWSDIVDHLFPVGVRRQPDLLADAVGELKEIRGAIEKINMTLRPH